MLGPIQMLILLPLLFLDNQGWSPSPKLNFVTIRIKQGRNSYYSNVILIILEIDSKNGFSQRRTLEW